MINMEKLDDNDFNWIKEAYLWDHATPAGAAARRLTFFRNEIMSKGIIQISITNENQIISSVTEFDAWVAGNFPYLCELSLYPVKSENRTIKVIRAEEPKRTN